MLAILYTLIILSISFIILYSTCVININFISGILVNLVCLTVMLLLKSYLIFYANLIVIIILSYRYYHEKKDRINSVELAHIFIFNMITIFISVIALFEMIYYYASRLGVQKHIPYIKISFVEAAPIAYVLMIYSITVILILSVSSFLSINKNDNAQFIIVKVAAAITFIVLLIIVVNAFTYFIIHNFPLRQANGIFDGNFLKDPIKYFYRSPKPFSDCLWFSATTFFTVGYGDMHPVGNIMYLLSTLQMISAYILGIIMIPILLCRLSNLLRYYQSVS
jgi:voltage-gated potassium channel